MAYSYDFKDNVVYGADDINAIRASILTKGVVEETDTSCKVVLSDNGVKILQGQAVFADGCRIEIDDDGVERAFVSGQTNYVYLYNNTLAGVCEVIVSETIPDGDYVMLAEIDAEGAIRDKREFTQLKTADVQRYVASFTASITVPANITAGNTIGTITLPKSNCSMIDFDMFFGSNVINVRVLPKENCCVMWKYYNTEFNIDDVMNIDVAGIRREIRFNLSGNELSMILESNSGIETFERHIRITGICIR